MNKKKQFESKRKGVFMTHSSIFFIDLEKTKFLRIVTERRYSS